LTAAEDELVGIARAMGERGLGVIEVVSDFIDFDTEFTTMRRMVEESSRPLSISVAQADQRPDQWARLLDAISDAAAHGLPMRGQVAARPIGLVLGLQATLNPFLGCPSYRDVHALALPERVAALHEPARRDAILDEARAHGPSRIIGRFERLFELGDPPDYEPPADASVAARAARAGVSPEELTYDIMLGDDGRAFLYFPLLNYTEGHLDAVRQMLLHEHTVPGLADGGAHVGTICDASFATTLLTLWARDRTRGERIALPEIVRRQARETARAVGLHDRGVLAPGMKADVVVVDLDRLRLRAPVMAYDLPAGGKRLLQRAEGYLHTFVSGVETYVDGEPTGALPGRLIRGGTV
jgi:N-acyl-D-aspartate/D-glutamate deacylase